MLAIHPDSQSPSVCYIACYIIKFQQTTFCFARQQDLCVQPQIPPTSSAASDAPTWLLEQGKQPSVQNEMFILSSQQWPSRDHRKRKKGNEWKALFAASLFLWQPSQRKAAPTCQYLISVGENWHEILPVEKNLLWAECATSHDGDLLWWKCFCFPWNV